MVGTSPDAFASGAFTHRTRRARRVGKANGRAHARPMACPPSSLRLRGLEWWARHRTRSRPAPLPTVRAAPVGWAKPTVARMRGRWRAHRLRCGSDGLNGGHVTGRVRVRRLYPPYAPRP